MAIKFYSNRERYACLSNFAPYPFELDGRVWPTVEHYFQAQKFPGSPYQEEIRSAAMPTKAKQLGRSRAHPLRADWERVKEEVMRRAVLQKFESRAELREVLLGTGDEELVEAAPRDYYWGCGASGTGRNRLGQILMEVREALRKGTALREP